MPFLRTILIHPKTCIPAILFFYPTLTKTLTVQDRHHCFFFGSTERPPNFNRDVNYIHVLALRLVCTEKIRLFSRCVRTSKLIKTLQGRGVQVLLSQFGCNTVKRAALRGPVCECGLPRFQGKVSPIPPISGASLRDFLGSLMLSIVGGTPSLCLSPLTSSTPPLSLRPPLLPFLFFLSLLLTISLHSHQLSGISVPIGWWTVHFFLIV